MGMTVKISARPENIHIVASGDFSLDEAKRTFLEVLDAVQRHGTSKVLFDGRDINGEPLLIERFYYGQFAADHVRYLKEHGWRGGEPQFAYVLEEPVLDWLRFGEMVARNRGLNTRAFDNPDDAVEWLALGLDEIESTGEPAETLADN